MPPPRPRTAHASRPREARSRAGAPNRPGAPSRPGARGWLGFGAGALLLLALTGLLYRGDLTLGFLSLDDPSYVLQNPYLRGFTADHLGHILSRPYFANFSPVHLLSYSIDHAIGGLDPAVYHGSSNLWAGLGAVATFALALLLTDSFFLSLGAGLLFVAHPAHVEAVAWISSRKDLVAAVFGVSSACAWILRRRSSGGGGGWYAASVVLFALGVGAKLSVVVLPILFLLYDVEVARLPFRRSLLDKLPLILVASVVAFMTFGAQPPTRRGFDPAEFGRDFGQNLWLLTGFGANVLNRARLSPQTPDLLRGAWTGFAILIPFLLGFGYLRGRRRFPAGWTFLGGWIVLALVPPQVLNFIHPVADRYLYLPSVGLTVLLAWVLWRAGSRFGGKGRLAGLVVIAALAVVWSGRTLAYLGEWRDPRSVWYGATRKHPDPAALVLLGSHYQDWADRLNGAPDPGTLRDAGALADRVWEGDPRLAPLKAEWQGGEVQSPEAAVFRAALLDSAEAAFREAETRKETLVEPNLYFRQGKLAFDRGRYPEAKQDFERALLEGRRHTSTEIQEELTVRCHQALAVIAWHESDWATSLAHFREVEKTQKESGRVWIPDLADWIRRLESRLPAPGN